jgi:hypothetical protein
MLLTVNRFKYDNQSTQGSLGIDGIFECYTLEPKKDQSGGKPYCIPAGIYSYVIGISSRFSRNVIKVLDVPGFTDIEIHPGNFPGDTHGCTVVGSVEGNDFVGHSNFEFGELMSKVNISGKVQYIDNNLVLDIPINTKV